MAANEEIAATPSERLAEVGASISTLFDNLKGIDSRQSRLESGSSTNLEHEGERFELWAVNLGLHHFGHSSLDYRLREVDLLQDTFRVLLIDLRKSLIQILGIDASGNFSPATATGTNISISNPEEIVNAGLTEFEQQVLIDDYGSDSEESQEDDYDLLVRDVSDIIDRLYKISTKIRTSSTHLRSSKALQYHEIDGETQVDLIERFRQIDELHLRELFRHYQSSRKGDADGFLATRLSAANTRRRQQFGHWRQHHEKMTQASARERQNVAGIRTSVNPLPTHPTNAPGQINLTLGTELVVEPSVITATHLTATRINLDEQSSVVSISTWAGSEAGTDEAQKFPEPPKSFAGLKYFQCPYCYTLCSSSHLEKRAWRSHLIHDLRPYICTYEQCELGHVMYDRRRDWVEHEAGTHRKSWRCLKHTDQTFTNISAYKTHLYENHADGAGTQLEDLLRAGETIASDPERPCPFCAAMFDNNGAMERHVAKHLERIALFALPRSTGLEDDRDEGRDSSSQVEGSRASCSGLSAFSNDLSIDIELRELSHASARGEPVSSNAIHHYQGVAELPMQSRIRDFLTNLQQLPAEHEEGGAPGDSTLRNLSSHHRLGLSRHANEGRQAREEVSATAKGFAEQDAGNFVDEDSSRESLDDIWIAVMGPEGTGKSSLIKALTRKDDIVLNDKIVSDKWSPDGPNILAYEFVRDNRKIHLVEIPDCTNFQDSGPKVLDKIAHWLTEMYRAGVRLSGLLYLHRINDTKIYFTTMRCREIFERLCGKDNFSSVIIVTTGWKAIDRTIGISREEILTKNSELWGDMIDMGSVVVRHDGSRESALCIMSMIVDRDERVVLQIQREMDAGLAVGETAAGSFLRDSIEKDEAELNKTRDHHGRLVVESMVSSTQLKNPETPLKQKQQQQREEEYLELGARELNFRYEIDNLQIRIEELHGENYGLTDVPEGADLETWEPNTARKVQINENNGMIERLDLWIRSLQRRLEERQQQEEEHQDSGAVPGDSTLRKATTPIRSNAQQWLSEARHDDPSIAGSARSARQTDLLEVPEQETVKDTPFLKALRAKGFKSLKEMAAKTGRSAP